MPILKGASRVATGVAAATVFMVRSRHRAQPRISRTGWCSIPGREPWRCCCSQRASRRRWRCTAPGAGAICWCRASTRRARRASSSGPAAKVIFANAAYRRTFERAQIALPEILKEMVEPGSTSAELLRQLPKTISEGRSWARRAAAALSRGRARLVRCPSAASMSKRSVCAAATITCSGAATSSPPSARSRNTSAATTRNSPI